MEISLRLDTLGLVETHYLRMRERYRDWPQFQLIAASRQARVFAYFARDVAEQLHQQILVVESALGLDGGTEDDDEDDDETDNEHEKSVSGDDGGHAEVVKSAERDSSAFSPAFAQALKQLNELARQRLPEPSTSVSQTSGELSTEIESDEDALEQLQDAFVQMMEVVRELAEEMSTDALKITGRFKCVRTNIDFITRAEEPDEDEDEEDEEEPDLGELVDDDDGLMDLEVELIMVLQLFEEGRARPEDLPAVELQLDVDDFERLHETLDVALERDRRSRRRR